MDILLNLLVGLAFFSYHYHPCALQPIEVDPDYALDCHKRLYSHRVNQIDSNGLICWDTVTVTSCWGRCDSNEISDWRFPYKRSYHPVCIHGDREPKMAILTNCDEGVEPGTEVYKYLEAVTCICTICRSSEASCESSKYQSTIGVLPS